MPFSTPSQDNLFEQVNARLVQASVVKTESQIRWVLKDDDEDTPPLIGQFDILLRPFGFHPGTIPGDINMFPGGGRTNTPLVQQFRLTLRSSYQPGPSGNELLWIMSHNLHEMRVIDALHGYFFPNKDNVFQVIVPMVLIGSEPPARAKANLPWAFSRFVFAQCFNPRLLLPE